MLSTLPHYSTVMTVALTLIWITLACDHTDQQPDKPDVTYTIPEQPEMATGYTTKPGWQTSEFAIASANPLVTDAGYQILKAGGSAVDAAVAAQMVLTLVEPQSSGIGGGAFLLSWDELGIRAYNGRERAPSKADETLFLDKDGEPLPFQEAVHSGLSVGVPGTLAMLDAAHQEHGVLPWEALFQPAITLAEEGFSLSPRLHQQLQADRRFRDDSIAKDFYYDENGDAHPAGFSLKNPALAEILRGISEDGIDAFYTGEVAENMVMRIRQHSRPGIMTVEDLENYPNQNFERDAICTGWQKYMVCGFPPPSSGHIAVMQILGILEYLETPEMVLQDSVPTAEWLHLFLEASKLAFADRNRYIGDPMFVDPPAESWESLLDSTYLSERAALIGETAMDEAEYGIPGQTTSDLGIHPLQPDAGTSHISVIDRKGNAVSMTTTIEQAFGSRIMSNGGTGLPGGFILNNELTDFSLVPEDESGRLVANRVEPGKQPRSSMSPTLIFNRETGNFVASVGSPGGAAIIHYTAKAIIGMLDWELNAQEAINLPNFANFNGPSMLEKDRFPGDVIRALEARDHEVVSSSLTSGIQAIQRLPDGYFGGADPRREGIVMGD